MNICFPSQPGRQVPANVFLSLVLGCVGMAIASMASAVDSLVLESPAPYQVIQRKGLAPHTGYAMVEVHGSLPESLDLNGRETQWEYRVVSLSNSKDMQVNIKDMQAPWRPLSAVVDKNQLQAQVKIPAGGWYRFEIRGKEESNSMLSGSVEPMGVGEVFVVAGQSYATNCNDAVLAVLDPQQRVVAFDSITQQWRVANDPQPVVDGSDGGSIWPPVGDVLVKELGVPVAFVNVAYGGTSSQQWMPNNSLHQRLVSMGQEIKRIRAVLWQQGESDVIAKTSTQEYVSNISAIRQAATAVWGVDVPWLLAKSTHHPTVYHDPVGEGQIRSGIDLLWAKPGFYPGPDTDALQGEHRGDANSRRHFSAIGQQCAAELWLTSIRNLLEPGIHSMNLRVGVAETAITPPDGFPLAGYYFERLADGVLDPLQAKAIVLRDDDSSAVLVVCDLIGIATDLSSRVRELASEKTGISASHIVIAATHTHTAPDYMKELWLRLGQENQDPIRAAYIDSLIADLVGVIIKANEDARPAMLESGLVKQESPVSFNRRFVMRDGSVKTWQNFDNPEVVRAAGPIDPEISLLTIRDPAGDTRAVLSNFALHLDTVGGQKWSADYPFYISQSLRAQLGDDVISIFGTGCCGDINHADPNNTTRNTARSIGTSLAGSMLGGLADLQVLQDDRLSVTSRTVNLPLQDATEAEVQRSIQILSAARNKESVDFFDHVTAHKKMMLDQFRHEVPIATTSEHITWGLSRKLAGVGATIPVDVTVMTIGQDVAVVCLPGEVFVELGLAIKQASPFRTTFVIELSNAVETIYIPHSAAYAGGSYEVTNSAVAPGSGELLVHAAVELLRECAAR